LLFNRGDSWDETLTIYGTNIGTSANHITIGSYGTGAKPILKNIIASGTGDYIDIEDIETNGSTAGSSNNGIIIAGFDNTTLRDCVTHNAVGSGLNIDTSSGNYSNNITVINHISYSNGSRGIWMGTSGTSALINSQTYLNNSNGISISPYGSDGVINIIGGKSYSNTGAGIASAADDIGSTLNITGFMSYSNGAGGYYTHATSASNVNITYSFAYDNAGYAYQCGANETSHVNCASINNTFVNNASGIVAYSLGTINVDNTISLASGNDIYISGNATAHGRNNIFGDSAPSGTGTYVNTLTQYSTDPLFINSSDKNYHLQSDSPARGAGVNVGLSKTNPPDIGAEPYLQYVPWKH
jgi:hypothetical protein